MGNFDIVMLYSGGADSMLMLHLALMAGKTPYCLLVDYGQKHVKELEYAVRQLESLGISWKTVSVKDLGLNSGLTGLQITGRWDNVHEMNVPGRNTIFIGLAISVAENMGIDEVWYGPDYSDRINLFPDCYQEYVVKMNEVLAISGVKPIKLVAPLLGMSKELILEILQNHFLVRMTDMHSGYDEAEQEEQEESTCDCSECQCIGTTLSHNF